MIRFQCPNCSKRLKSNPGTTGKIARCNRCQATMLVPEEGAEPIVATDEGSNDRHSIPELGFSDKQVTNEASSEEPDTDEKAKRAKERRARARLRARERRAKLRTTGFVMMLAAGFFGVIVTAMEIVRISNKAALSGTVTYEGKPIAKGYITFTPVDGQGEAASARIVDGRYEVSKLSRGENIVLITAVADMQFSKARPDPRLEGAADAPPDLVGPDAIGNNKAVTIKRGTHVLNFDLLAPPPLKEPAKDPSGQPAPSH